MYSSHKCIINPLLAICLHFREEHPGSRHSETVPRSGLRREVRHLLGRWNQEIRSFVTCWRVWETTFTKGSRIIIFCQKTIQRNGKISSLKSSLFWWNFWKPRSNLGRIYLPSFKNSYRPIQVIYSGRLEIFPWNLVTSSNGMAMKQLYKGLFRYLDKLYGYVWICMDKRYLRSNWIWYCKNGKTKAEYSEYLCVAETKAVHLGLKRIAIACKMGVSKLGDP